MDLLKRSLAPITDAAWETVKKEAARALASQLTARKIVDIEGPKGIAHPAVGLGHLDVTDCEVRNGKMCYGIHRVLPLVEVRASFEMNIWNLDDTERGAKDVDVDAVIEAARNVAGFEERAIYRGLPKAGIVGMEQAAEGSTLTLGEAGSAYPDAVARAKLILSDREVEGPYALVLGPRPFRILEGTSSGYPIKKQVEEIIGGPILYSAFLEGGFFVSTRGGDLELTLGQDISLGYETHDTRTVRLYLSESFAFRVLEPRSIVKLKMGGEALPPPRESKRK
jgi:uncharacterized linocin/CFP29 family protein